MGFYRVLLGFTEFGRVVTGFYWVLHGLAGLLRSLTAIYLVLLGFTEFCRVVTGLLLGFTLSGRVGWANERGVPGDAIGQGRLSLIDGGNPDGAGRTIRLTRFGAVHSLARSWNAVIYRRRRSSTFDQY